MNEITSILLEELERAVKENEVPVSALIVHNNKVIAKAHNMKLSTSNPMAHAEVICINKASSVLKTYNLIDCELYSTLKPCKMCREIIKEARIKKVFYVLDSIKEINENTKYIEFDPGKENKENMKKTLVDFFGSKR